MVRYRWSIAIVDGVNLIQALALKNPCWYWISDTGLGAGDNAMVHGQLMGCGFWSDNGERIKLPLADWPRFKTRTWEPEKRPWEPAEWGRNGSIAIRSWAAMELSQVLDSAI